MPLHPDFEKIHARFVQQYGDEGHDRYFAWLKKKGYDDTKPFPKKQGRHERECIVRGCELREQNGSYYVNGFITTTHVDNGPGLRRSDGSVVKAQIRDVTPKETLESWAVQMKTKASARIMGLHHSEGRTGEYGGVADIENSPPEVIQLSDDEWGLYASTRLINGDPLAEKIIQGYEGGELIGFSVTYDTTNSELTDFDYVGDEIVRVVGPDAELCGYTAASNPVVDKALVSEFGYREFREMLRQEVRERQPSTEENTMPEAQEITTPAASPGAAASAGMTSPPAAVPGDVNVSALEHREFLEWKQQRGKEVEMRQITEKVMQQVDAKLETAFREKVLSPEASQKSQGEERVFAKEMREFLETVKPDSTLDIREQFRLAGEVADKFKLHAKPTSRAEERQYVNFGVSGRNLVYRGLGITTNQNTDTDYLQSGAELQDAYDPVIYNALNQATLTWTVLAKDDYSKKGNNQVQFTLKTAANATAAFYTGNAVSTGNVTRLKYQTKFKKLQVGVSIDGDMIAAARGGPIGDVFSKEVADSTDDMLAVLNAALYAEVGLETAAGVIGFEYIADSAGNTSLYSLTRSSANKLAPASAGDTYISGGSAIVSLTNLRAAIKQCVVDGSKKRNLVFFTHPTQGDLFRSKFDNLRRHDGPTMTRFGFETDIFFDGVPVFEDKDCGSDDWFCVDIEAHRVAIWVPPTIERLGKSADSEDAFIKMYLATYNRAPRRLVMIHTNATS